MHVLLCKLDEKWVLHVREHETVNWSPIGTELNGRLRQAVEASFVYGFNGPRTYSEREAAEVMADVAEAPEQLAGVDRQVDLQIQAPERRWPTDDRWQTVHRDGARLSSAGGGFRGFRQEAPYEAVLKENVLWFFGFDRPESPTHYKTFCFRSERPHRRRELYLRPTWSARELAPNSFAPFLPEMPQLRHSPPRPEAKAT